MSLKHTILENLQDASKIDFEVLLLSSLLLQRFRYGSVKDTDVSVDKEFDQGPPTKNDIKAVIERLIAFIHTSPPPLLLQQAITTLGASGDDSVCEVIQPILQKYLQQMLEINTVVYASMVALDDCGAAVFSRNNFGLSEFDLNITDANQFLKNIETKKNKNE